MRFSIRLASALSFASLATGLLATPANAHAGQPVTTTSAAAGPADSSVRRAPVHLEDDDPDARFVLRAADGSETTCVGSCDVMAPVGFHHVSVTHDGSVDETDFVLYDPTTVRGRTKSYVGVGLGIPMIIVGAGAAVGGMMGLGLAGSCDGCSDAEAAAARAKEPAERRDAWVVIGMGAAGVIGGIVLISTAHGSSILAETREPASAKAVSGVALSVLPTPGGVSMSLVGAF